MTVAIINQAPSAIELASLRHAVGWGETDLDMAQQAINNSLFHAKAIKNNQVIGVVRIVGDGALFYYIQDLIVHPEYQQQGIGDKLMTQVEYYLRQTAKTGATIGLFSAKGKENFYQKYGYSLRPNAKLGNGMCKFV